MTTFTKEQLKDLTMIAGDIAWVPRLAAFALAQMEGKEAAEAERDEAIRFIETAGYRRCDIPACNCGSWHGGHAMARLGEIRDALEAADVNTNGLTILGAVGGVLAERDDARRELALLTKAIQDSYEMYPDGKVYAIETDEDAWVTWPNHPEVLEAVRRALARKEGA